MIVDVTQPLVVQGDGLWWTETSAPSAPRLDRSTPSTWIPAPAALRRVQQYHSRRDIKPRHDYHRTHEF